MCRRPTRRGIEPWLSSEQEANLEGLTNLEVLNLSYTEVTDAGLEHLKELTNLKSLDLKYTNVTDEGVKKLQQALPNCKIRTNSYDDRFDDPFDD